MELFKNKCWSAQYVDLFNDVYNSGIKYYNIELPAFNFKANSTIEFKQFSNLKKILDKDIGDHYLSKENRKPTDSEYYESVRIYFKRGFQYCYYYKFEIGLTATFNFTPTMLYKNYNKIITFKKPKSKTKTWAK